MDKKGALTWEQIVAAVLVVVVIVVLIIFFAGRTGSARKDISRCKGLLGMDEYTGQCRPTKCLDGETQVTTFGSDCGKNEICCLGKKPGK